MPVAARAENALEAPRLSRSLDLGERCEHLSLYVYALRHSARVSEEREVLSTASCTYRDPSILDASA